MNKTFNPCDECRYGKERRDGSGNDTTCKICEFHDALRRTAEDDKAREEGRLVVLPCKVGQTVYEVNLPDEFAEVCEYIVQDVSTKKIMFCDDWYPLSYIGKTVFLTRAKAEAALEVHNG